jgi:Asp-tRNA(Asn)/Glu-tRNA(Gln) amidotransferase A subunit family amidase
MSTGANPAATALLNVPLRRRAEVMKDSGVGTGDFINLLNDHVSAVDPQVQAYAEWRPSRSPGALASYPPLTIAYKDLIHVAGFATRYGSSQGIRCYPRSSARVAAELDGQGVLCLGKADTSEFGLGLNTNSRNPRHPLYSTSGSSCGSGAAVAAAMCDFSIATDTLSSARNPAANCGVAAMRLTQRDRWRDGIMPVSPTLDALGVVARTCDDLEFVFGRTGLAQLAAEVPGGPRIRVLRDWVDDDHHPGVRRAWDCFLRRLEASGITVSAVSFPHWPQRWIAWDLLIREAAEVHSKRRMDLELDYSEPVRNLLEAGRAIADERYRQLLRQRGRFAAALAVLADAEPSPLVFPHDASLPRRIDEPPYVQVCHPADAVTPDPGFAAVASLAGLPSLCLPLPVREADAPLSVELVGPPHSEWRLARVGCALEKVIADE